MWKKRQKDLGIDDFGNPTGEAVSSDERQALVPDDD